jgi:hypothetical protein
VNCAASVPRPTANIAGIFDHALARRFQKIDVVEPTVPTP